MQPAGSWKNLFADSPTAKIFARFRRAAFRPEEAEERVLLRVFKPILVHVAGESACAEIFKHKITKVSGEKWFDARNANPTGEVLAH